MKIWLLSVKLSEYQSFESINPQVWARKNNISLTTWLKQKDIVKELSFCTVANFRVLKKYWKQYIEKAHCKIYVMDEVLNGWNVKLDNAILQERSDSQQTRRNQCKIYAVTNASDAMIQTDKKFTLAGLKSLLPLFSHCARSQNSVHVLKRLVYIDM